MPAKELEYFPFQVGMRIENQTIELGSKPINNPAIILAYPGVSKRQARLFFQNEQWYVEDLGSDNGTWIISENKLILADVNKPKGLNEVTRVLFGVVVAEIRVIRD